MFIKPFTAGTYVSDRNAANLTALKDKLDTLSTQLATQQASDSYGGLGSARTTSLSAHATLSALDGYDSAIDGATTRVNLSTASITQVATLGDQVRSSLAASGTFGTGPAVDNSIKIARSNLDAALDALNQQSAGRYLFGGRETETPPVATSDEILNGTASPKLDGLKGLIAERKSADGSVRTKDASGNDVLATGGLAVGPATAGTFSLSEQANTANRENFGFILRDVVSSNTTAISQNPSKFVPATQPKVPSIPPATPAPPAVTLSFSATPKDGDVVRITVNQPDGTQKLVDYTARTNPVGANEFKDLADLEEKLQGQPVAAAQSGTPPGISLAFSPAAPASTSISVSATTPPADGDTVTVTLGLRDGMSTTITLTAKASGSLTAGQFLISTDPAVTAKNLQTALSAALDKSATTTLAASSSVLASQDFFAGSKQVAFAPRRVDTVNGGFVSDPKADKDKQTVIWYTGDDTSTDPRKTATVQVDGNRKVGIGAQANEAPIQTVLAGIAALAAESFTDAAAGTAENTRYQALSERSRALLVSDRSAGSIESIASDLSLAARNMQDAKAQNRSTRATLEDTLGGIDTVDTNAVTVQLLALQTQLQASYQITSTLSKLSLVNYIN